MKKFLNQFNTLPEVILLMKKTVEYIKKDCRRQYPPKGNTNEAVLESIGSNCCNYENSYMIHIEKVMQYHHFMEKTNLYRSIKDLRRVGSLQNFVYIACWTSPKLYLVFNYFKGL